MRSIAKKKKKISQEMKVYMDINTNIDVGHDPIIKLSHRTGKSKTKYYYSKTSEDIPNGYRHY